MTSRNRYCIYSNYNISSVAHSQCSLGGRVQLPPNKRGNDEASHEERYKRVLDHHYVPVVFSCQEET